MKPARVQAVPHDGARGEGGPHHGGGGQAHREADRGLLRQQVVDAARLGNQDRRQGEETCFTPMGFDIYTVFKTNWRSFSKMLLSNCTFCHCTVWGVRL